MLTRVLFVLVLILGPTAVSAEGELKLLALGLTDHEVTAEELEKGEALPVPRFNTGGVAYVWAAGLKKGDIVEITLNKGKQSLMRNTETLAEDRQNYLLQAGKRGVPAGGWPEGTYYAEAKITRDGKPLISESSEPITFD